MTKRLYEPMTASEWRNVGLSNEIAQQMDLVDLHVERVLTRKQPACYVFGGSGLGKNFVVEQALKRHAMKAIYAQPARVHDFIMSFHTATWGKGRNPLPLVCDEAELIFGTVNNLNILKLATDDNPANRKHGDFKWTVEQEDGEGKTKKVTRKGASLNAPIIAMTNKDLQAIQSGPNGNHAKAVMDRVSPIGITNDPATAWEYSCYIAMTTGAINYVGGDAVPLTKRVEALTWFTDNMRNLQQVSVRTLKGITQKIMTTPADRLERDLGLMLMPMAQRAGGYPPQQPDWRSLILELGR